MALCVRRLRGASGLGGRWKNEVRGAGGAAERLREGSRVRDVILFRELRPGIGAPVRRTQPPAAMLLSPGSRSAIIRPPAATRERDRALQRQQMKDGLTIHCELHPQPASQFLHWAEPGGRHDGDKCGYLSSAQLDCFRSLFEPGVCRAPYQALVFPTPPAAQEGILGFSLSAPRYAEGQTSGGHQPNMEEHLAVMHEKLREELPKALWRSPNISLYRRDVEFVSSVFHVHLRGTVKYQLFFSFVRMLLLCYYCNASISILKLTSHPETNSIHARWSFTGLPIHCLYYVFKSNKKEMYRTYDLFSIFQLAPDGLICLHKLERVMPSSPLTITKKTVLAAALLGLGLGQDRPALNLLSTPKLSQEL